MWWARLFLSLGAQPRQLPPLLQFRHPDREEAKQPERPKVRLGDPALARFFAKST